MPYLPRNYQEGGSVSTQIIREDPQIEAYRLGLLGDAQQFIQQQIATGQLPPDYQVAGLAGLEEEGARRAAAGIGAYEPFISGGLGGIRAAGDVISATLPTIPATGAQFDPLTAQAYMDPYEEQVVQQALQDLQRQSDIARVADEARATGAGAFGGSREGILQAENVRNLQEAQARTAGQLRSQGYQQSLQQAQNAFEAAQQRRLSGIGLAGQLGGQLGSLGIQEAGLGELTSNLGLNEARTLVDIGGVQRAQQQAELDALRQTNLARQAFPYQQYSFLSDIYQGTPSGQQSITSQAVQQPSAFQTLAGTGVGALASAAAAKRVGLF